MTDFKRYRRKQISEFRPYDPDGHDQLGLHPGVTVSAEDRKNGSPKVGDMIARNPKNHDEQWLVAAKYFNGNFEAVRS
jgi:hypothetical protein